MFPDLKAPTCSLQTAPTGVLPMTKQSKMWKKPAGMLVNALYKAYTDVTGDTEHKPMVIGGGTYAKSLKNIIAFGPEKEGIDYRIHGADEFILVSGMEEAVLIYMEAIKNLLAI